MTDLPAPLVPARRKAISKKTRFEVFKRDGFACQYCGAHPPGVLLHIDHIQAVANGGDNDFDNLIAACEPCNLGKGARPLNVAPESLSAKAARIAEAEEQLAGYSAIMEAKRQRIESDIWRVVEALTGETSIPRDQFQSVKMFIERLGVHDTLDAAAIARGQIHLSARRQFKYFCGVCWNKVRENGG